MNASPGYQCQNADSYAYQSSRAVSQGMDISTCESAANSSAELHNGLNKAQGSPSAIKTNHPMSGLKSVTGFSSPLSDSLTLDSDEKKVLSSTITSGFAGPDAWNTTQISSYNPSAKGNVSSCTPNTADDGIVVYTPQQAIGTPAGAKKRGRPLGSKNKKKRVQPQKNPFREMLFGPVPKKGERTRRSRLPVADKPGDYNVRQKGKVRKVTFASPEALSVGNSHVELTDPLHTQLVDPLQIYSNSRGSQSIPPNTVNRAHRGPWLESQQGGRVASAPIAHHPLSPQQFSSSVKNPGPARVSSFQDSAAISAVFRSEILPIIRQACLPFQHILSTSALHAIEREVSILLVIFSDA